MNFKFMKPSQAPVDDGEIKRVRPKVGAIGDIADARRAHLNCTPEGLATDCDDVPRVQFQVQLSAEGGATGLHVLSGTAGHALAMQWVTALWTKDGGHPPYQRVLDEKRFMFLPVNFPARASRTMREEVWGETRSEWGQRWVGIIGEPPVFEFVFHCVEAPFGSIIGYNGPHCVRPIEDDGSGPLYKQVAHACAILASAVPEPVRREYMDLVRTGTFRVMSGYEHGTADAGAAAVAESPAAFDGTGATNYLSGEVVAEVKRMEDRGYFVVTPAMLPEADRQAHLALCEEAAAYHRGFLAESMLAWPWAMCPDEKVPGSDETCLALGLRLSAHMAEHPRDPLWHALSGKEGRARVPLCHPARTLPHFEKLTLACTPTKTGPRFAGTAQGGNSVSARTDGMGVGSNIYYGPNLKLVTSRPVRNVISDAYGGAPTIQYLERMRLKLKGRAVAALTFRLHTDVGYPARVVAEKDADARPSKRARTSEEA